jgi:hypothetical protein
VPQGFLVSSPSCQIRSLDPFPPDVLNIFSFYSSLDCDQTRPLTFIEQDFENDIVKVVINHENEENYFKQNDTELECFYKELTRKQKSDFGYE